MRNVKHKRNGNVNVKLQSGNVNQNMRNVKLQRNGNVMKMRNCKEMEKCERETAKWKCKLEHVKR